MDAGPLSLGQLSVWHDIRDLPLSRRHEPNNATVWELPPEAAPAQVRAALTALARRHPSLRTRYDLSDPNAPRQWTLEGPADVELPVVHAANTPADEAALRLASEPFDLGGQDGWRARLLTGGSGPSRLAFVKHHIVADAWAQEVLRRDLLRELSAPGSLREPADGPAELAAQQHGPDGMRRRRAALEHWERLLAQAPDTRLPDTGDTPGEVVQATLRSAPALAAARTLADRARVSVASAVLAAYLRTVARRFGSDTLLVQLMSANRFAGRWKNLVTSMNQWVPALVDGTRTEVADLARAVHWDVLRAVRHGMHDVTEVAELRTRTPQAPLPACAFNHVAVPSTVDEQEAVHRPESPEKPTVSFETPFTTIGPRCYARSQEDGRTLSVRLTARDVGRAHSAALLWEIHDTLLAAA
ncbi:condensation domain-containing protein [Streptomyces sp. NPDC058877]|uniref:condensation domain-containing protein n=1 Tax=unclassified Streptomyces TaxID=2593676 RepID=UPI003694ACBD